MEVYYGLPPVSRTLTAAAVVLSALAYSGIVPVYPLVFYLPKILKLQLWRLVTCFFLTSPQFGIILDPYFLYTYASQLETGSSRFSQPGDFFVYIFFVASFILLAGGIFLKGVIFLSPLTLALAYTFAQDNPRRITGFYVLNFEARFLPWVLLFITFILNGPQSALLQFTGLLAAHMYEFLTRIWPELGGGRRWLSTPASVRNLFGGDARTPQTRAAGTAYAARPQDAPAQGRTTGFGLGNAWNSRGPGRRLGD